MDLICRVAAPELLRLAVDAGADAIQCGFADVTNSDRLMAQHFTLAEMAEAVRHAHAAGRQLILAVDTPMRGGDEHIWTDAVDRGVALGVDGIVVSDVGLLAYIANRQPQVRRHFCLPLNAVNAAHIDFLGEAFGLHRAVLPSGFLVEEVVQLARACRCEIEVGARAMLPCPPAEGAGSGRPSLDMLSHCTALDAAGVAALRLDGMPHGLSLVDLIARLRAEPASAAA